MGLCFLEVLFEFGDTFFNIIGSFNNKFLILVSTSAVLY